MEVNTLRFSVGSAILFFGAWSVVFFYPFFVMKDSFIDQLCSANLTQHFVGFVAFSSFMHTFLVLSAHFWTGVWTRASLTLMWVFTIVDWVVVFGLLFWFAPRRKKANP